MGRSWKSFNMTDPYAVVTATRKSANTLAECSRFTRQIEDAERRGHCATACELAKKLARANARYERAQAVFAANPLPADK